MNAVLSSESVLFLLLFHQYAKNHELRFTDLTFDDSGMYQCFAENRHGTIYANAELRVFGEYSSFSINICCKTWFWALGLPELKILRNTASSSTECVVFSAGAPSFEWNPVKSKLLGAKNGRVVIDCKPRAAPRPSISWSKGTELLHNSSRSELTQRSSHGDLSRAIHIQSVFHDRRIFIWPDGTLELLNVTKSDEGKYTCFAENDRGRANGTGSLSVTGTTRKPNPNNSSSWLLLLLLC